MDTIPSEMLRGHVDTIILLSLLDCDKHTSQIKEEIESRVDGQFELKQGTFYSCLQRIVNQGFVTEYRSSSADGKRRKFYQLTEKGKAYIEDNKDIWLFSRNVIDNLIQVPQDTVQITSISEYEAKKAQSAQAEIIAEQANEINELSSKLEQIESKIQQIENINTSTQEEVVTQKTLDEQQDNLTELEKFLASQFDEPKDEAPQASQNIKIEDNVISFEAVKESNQPKEKDILDLIVEVEKEEENKVITPDFTVNSVVSERKNDNYSYLNDRPQNNNYVDDYYTGQEAITHDYKDVLSKLFPQKVDTIAIEEKNPAPTPSTTQDVSNYFDDVPYEEPRVLISEPKKPKAKFIKNVKKSQVFAESSYEETTQKPSKFDFSDINALAESEGFKVKISSTYGKKDIGKIYINKLIANSALTYYAMLVFELFILALATINIVEFAVSTYFIIGAILAIFPICALLMYFIDPMKKVQSLITFKNIIGFVFIVALNLIIIVFVYSVLINIDFTNIKDLTLYICYPLIFILNLPLYFFIKYLKLDNQKYYS